MNVYIVTKGYYSDYCIIAVYDEAYKEDAERHAKFIGGSVEIHPLNEVLPLKDGLAPYRVWYWVDNVQCTADDFPGTWSDEIDKSDPDIWTLYVYADSPQHAAKIAMERVTREKAFQLPL